MEDRDEFSLDTYRIAGECTLVYQHVHYPKVSGSIPHSLSLSHARHKTKKPLS